MNYSSDIIELYSHTLYKPRQYQINIMNKIINNIEHGKKMQAIKMPNCTGKTIMCNFLAVLLNKMGYKVMVYDPYAESLYNRKLKIHSTLQSEIYDNEFIKAHKATLCLGINNIDSLTTDDVDIILTDALGSGLDSSIDLRHLENYLYDNDSKGIKSSSQLEIQCIYRIQQLVKEKSEIAVVSFEAGKSALESGFTPIIATDYITCFGISDFDFEQLNGIENEYLMTYEQLLQNKLNNKIKLQNKQYDLHTAIKIDNDISADISDIQKALFNIESLIAKQTVQSDVSGIKTSIKHLSNEVNEINDKIDEIADNVSDIKNIVIATNKIVSDKKQFMSLYFDIHPDDDEEAEKMISKFTTMVAEQVIIQGGNIQVQDEFKRMEKLSQLSLGNECWDKMSIESKRFLVTAKYTLYEQLSLDGLGDFSGVCVLASKAFELEMAHRFITGYKNYLANTLNLGNDYETKWPGALLKKANGRITLKEVCDFTLGDCKGLMNFRTEREPYRRNNNELFIDYCRDALLKIQDEDIIKAKLLNHLNMIQTVKDRFRNPASHKSPVQLTLAKECIDYIMEVEKVLGVLLADFQL